MTRDELDVLASLGESEQLEFKESFGQRHPSRQVHLRNAQTIVADGLLFGVTATGEIVGQQVSDRTIEEIAAELRHIDPPAFPSIERVPTVAGREVIVDGDRSGRSLDRILLRIEASTPHR